MRTKLQIGASIRARRIAWGYRQRVLARLLDVQDSVISRWETGAVYPSPAHAARLASVLGGVAGDYQKNNSERD